MRGDTPGDIVRFEGWLVMSLAAGILVAILMFNEVIREWGGPVRAVVVTIVLFGGAWVLMVYTSRRRSNLARWLLVIGSTLAVIPYLAHVADLLADEKVLYLSFVQAALQVVAIYYLFTPAARAWFAGPRPPPELKKDAGD